MFLSLLNEMPFVVTTPSGNIWVVDGSKIVNIEDGKQGDRKAAKDK